MHLTFLLPMTYPLWNCEEIMEGMIDGGWSFVWAAYGITWIGLSAYIFSLYKRGQK
jgi:CcmD family protein